MWGNKGSWRSQGWGAAAAASGGGGAKSAVTTSTGGQYLTTTWANAPTLATKVTLSFWQRFVSAPAFNSYWFATAPSGGVIFGHGLSTTSFKWGVRDEAGAVFDLRCYPGFNPETANWHHVCVSIDTTLATAANRVKVYCDGSLIADDNLVYPAQNSNLQVTASGIASYIGIVNFLPANVAECKFAYYYLIDGQALTPSSFTTGTGLGSIHPATYAGTYGTNGFFLNFNGGTLADASGSGTAPTWTAPNGITYSSDVPA